MWKKLTLENFVQKIRQKRADAFWPKKPNFVHKKWKMDIYVFSVKYIFKWRKLKDTFGHRPARPPVQPVQPVTIKHFRTKKTR